MYSFPGTGLADEDIGLMAEFSIILLIDDILVRRPFHFAQVDDIVAPVYEKVNLDAGFAVFQFCRI